MSRTIYVNGRYLPYAAAAVHVEDRGLQFADSVYEVIAVDGGRLVDEREHLDRLDRSLAAIRMQRPMSRAALQAVMRELVRRNRITGRAALYLQVTRGVAPRNHAFPPNGVAVSLVMTVRPLRAIERDAHLKGVSVITVADLRWKRADIKSTALLANVLGRQEAVDAGAFEAWLVDADGMVSEGTASNAWIVTRSGGLVTRRADHAILDGITRRAVVALAREQGIPLEERPFGVDEARSAAEAFLTSTTSLIRPVVRIDDRVVGDGTAGPITGRLFDLVLRRIDGGRAARGGRA